MTEPVDAHFLAQARRLQGEPRAVLPEELEGGLTLQLFDSQLRSRHLDLAARWLRAEGQGFYTIGSSGHESNAAVAAALRPSDPALLHYRSGGFYLQRAAQLPGHDGVRDVLLGLVGAAAEPISGGRRKVFGHRDLAIIPQTSTIASHLPRAMGLAFSLSRAAKLGTDDQWPADSVVVASFGDASASHSTAVGAINAAAQTSYQGLPMPLLLVCEDNGVGISVRTPAGWIESTYSGRAGLAYFAADGQDLAEALRVSRQAAAYVRTQRRPAFLHLRTVRLMGHAGADVESAYRSQSEIVAEMTRDPVLGTASLLVATGELTPSEVIARYEDIRDEVREAAMEVSRLPLLAGADAVMAPLVGPDPADVAALAETPADASARAEVFGDTLPENEGPLTLAQAINRALHEGAASDRGLIAFGEDVGRKGGVYGVTRLLQRRLGTARVFNTLLDEQSILGLALGAGLAGLLPVPEIQYLAYVHNAEDQLRGEAATLPFFSNGQFRNPMVVRVAGYGYQKGFGGHFHNDNALGVLLDIPGLIIASPSRPDDAAVMMRTCLAAARLHGSTCVFLEPIALYHASDLHEPGDGKWATPYPAPGMPSGLELSGPALSGLDVCEPALSELGDGKWATPYPAPGMPPVPALPEPTLSEPALSESALAELSLAQPASTGPEVIERTTTAPALGRARCYGDGGDLTIVTFANGVPMSLRVARRLEAEGIGVRVLDLRWLRPLPVTDMLGAANATGRVLVVDETRRTGGVSEGIVTALMDARFEGRITRVTSKDSFIPLGEAALDVLLSEDTIERAARAIVRS
ncbi:MAG: thiamine pyrophosphate-dependent enzyme [Ornithinimicrobium sp.]